MDMVNYFNELLALDEFEQRGKKHYLKTGKELNVAQYYYLSNHATDKLNADLFSEEAIAIQNEFQSYLHNTYHSKLTEDGFISAGKNIEVEQLMRYIHIESHQHNFFELVCVLNGTCTQHIGDHITNHKTGDLTIIPPNIDHELYASEDCLCFTIKIRSSSFNDTFVEIQRTNSLLAAYFTQTLSLPGYRCALTLHGESDVFIRDTLLNMFYQQTNGKNYSEKLIESMVSSLFFYYMQNYQDNAEFLASEAPVYERISEIVSYIFENYQHITLAETAKHFYISPPYLSTKIHAITGQTFSELLRNYKLDKAAEALRLSNNKLEQICESIGYSDCAQFIRSFKKKYGMTPGQYRKAAKANA